jgi:hypothetical protein
MINMKAVKESVQNNPSFLVFFVCFWLMPSVYWFSMHNWGRACNATDIKDYPSPQREWIIRKQTVGCSVLAGSLSINLMLIPAERFVRFYVPEQEIFSVDISDPSIIDNPPMDIKWIDEQHVHIISPICSKPCAGEKEQAVGLPTLVCTDFCKLKTAVGNIEVRMSAAN